MIKAALVPDAAASARLPADVKAVVHIPAGAGGDCYPDPVALAGLIVSAAQLAWSVFGDLRSRRPGVLPAVELAGS
jgi:hypothetical protein